MSDLEPTGRPSVAKALVTGIAVLGYGLAIVLVVLVVGFGLLARDLFIDSPRPTATAIGSPSANELALLSGLRTDIAGTCDPIRTGLAGGAIAGVECRPSSEVVDRARGYLFATQDELQAAYGAWVADRAIDRDTHNGRCHAERASEGPYVPSAGPGLAAERSACYIDPAGVPHHAATVPPFVMIELVGTATDFAALERWAWLGNQDQPGSPTVWRESGPVSPEK